MGTNFYINIETIKPARVILNGVMGEGFVVNVEKTHLGKRSGAGPWCHDCDRSYAVVPNMIHQRVSTWHDSCPRCDAPRFEATNTCSFTWAMPESGFWDLLGSDLKIRVEDESGAKYRIEDIREMLDGCKIKLYHSVGQDFS